MSSNCFFEVVRHEIIEDCWGYLARAVGRVAVVVLAGVIVGMRRWMQPPTKPETAVGQTVVDDFLAKIRDGHAGEAWDATTTEFKSIEGRESFISTAAKAPLLKDQLHFVSTQDVMVGDKKQSEYIYQSPDTKWFACSWDMKGARGRWIA